MARWLSLFSEYNFIVHYKPGKTNIAITRRPDYVQSGRHAIGDECAVCVAKAVAAIEVAATSPLRDLIPAAYGSDAECVEMLKYLRDPSNTARRRLCLRSRARVDR
ncbi:reverse transcriptase [Phytophthora megakarya]|uniref:Reverse transcriptase n=1 Tax=Phytophthora megakarya TaxID=4795 RepID=A0A225W835_9STRA|nr:reverse transcriptase [Phytophthora megakarya]